MPDQSKSLTKAERLTETYEKLVRLKLLDKLDNKACANILGVTERTVYNYLASDEYKALVEERRAEWREDALSTMSEMTQTALETLKDVMENKNAAAMARVQAAVKILEFAGVQVKQEQTQQKDDRDELDRLTRLLAQRPQVNIFNVPPQPGGMLPAEISGRVVDAYLPAKAIPAPMVDAPSPLIEHYRQLANPDSPGSGNAP